MDFKSLISFTNLYAKVYNDIIDSNRPPQPKDPLENIDIIKEHQLIQNKASKLSSKIRSLVVERYNQINSKS